MSAPSHPNLPPCHVCGSRSLTVIPGYAAFRRVTSDCKPWAAGGGLGICGQCGCAQAIIDAAWEADAKRIYADYLPYHQGSGVEQNVFDSLSGAATTRSQRLVQRLKSSVPLPTKGKLLDIGCGNGALLRAFGGGFPGWTMAGVEVHEHLRPVIESIERVEKLYTCPISDVPGQFPLISLIHVLEHIASPVTFLSQVRDKLEAGGLLLIEVPDCAQNPFMLLVADHASHFFLSVLKRTVAGAGFEIVLAANDWVAKELTVVARKTERGSSFPPPPERDTEGTRILSRSLAWLAALVENARAISQQRPFGIFGTSIAATWLFGELDGRVDFFVDEDPNRPGKTCLGRPIYDPRGIPAGAHVFIALPPAVATGIHQRMEALRLGARFYQPEPPANLVVGGT